MRNKSIKDISFEDKLKISTDDIELQFKKEELESYRQDRGERKRFADNIFRLLICFLLITLGIVIASGIDALRFGLSDTILITLLTTTSADIIGIFIFVVKYLFKANNR